MSRFNKIFIVVITFVIFIHVNKVFCDTPNNNKGFETMNGMIHEEKYKHELVIKYNTPVSVSVSLHHDGLNVNDTLEFIEKELDHFPYTHVVTFYNTKVVVFDNYRSQIQEIAKKHNNIQLLFQVPTSNAYSKQIALTNAKKVLGITMDGVNDNPYNLYLLPANNGEMLAELDILSQEESLKIVENEMIDNNCKKLTITYDYKQQNTINDFLEKIESLAEKYKISYKIIRIKEIDFKEDQRPFINPN